MKPLWLSFSALVATHLGNDAKVGAFRTVRESGVPCNRAFGVTDTLPQCRKIAALFSAHPAEQPESSSLSGLVNGMLQAQQEMAKEARELQNRANLQRHNPGMPVLGSDGVYSILSEDQLHNFQTANADKLVILKFSSPVCKACRELKQKFRHLNESPNFAGRPVVFADIVLSNNKNVQDPLRDYVTSQLRVQKIPSLQFYSDGTHLVDTVGCDPETGCSWSKIKQQMVQFVEQWAPQIQTEVTEASSSISDQEIVETMSEDMESINAVHTTTSTPEPIHSKTLLQSLQGRLRDALFRRRD